MGAFFPTGSALIDGPYRYLLQRDLPCKGPTMSITLVNPSYADAEANDHTVRKIIGFATRLKVGRVVLTNKFAYRATDIKLLAEAEHPVGPKNDFYIKQALREADIHVVAWGPLGKLPPILRNRWRRVARMMDDEGIKPLCWGSAKDGQPLHPVMLGYDRVLTEWVKP